MTVNSHIKVTFISDRSLNTASQTITDFFFKFLIWYSLSISTDLYGNGTTSVTPTNCEGIVKNSACSKLEDVVEYKNLTIFNIIRWVDGMNNSSNKMFQALFFFHNFLQTQGTQNSLFLLQKKIEAIFAKNFARNY